MRRSVRRETALAAVLFLLVPAPAFAYIDPGAGGMLLQLLLAGTAGLMVVLNLFRKRIVEFFRRRR